MMMLVGQKAEYILKINFLPIEVVHVGQAEDNCDNQNECI